MLEWFNSVPGHHHSKAVSSFLTKLLSPLSVRYFSARSVRFLATMMVKDLNSNCL